MEYIKINEQDIYHFVVMAERDVEQDYTVYGQIGDLKFDFVTQSKHKAEILYEEMSQRMERELYQATDKPKDRTKLGLAGNTKVSELV